jgi:hypothetical protein
MELDPAPEADLAAARTLAAWYASAAPEAGDTG